MYLAVDLEGSKRCIVKHARRDALLLATNTDARDRLRAEAATLARLGRGPWPALLALVDEGDDVFLAEEEIRGHGLWHGLAALAARGEHLREAAIIRIGVELADALEQVHAHGLVVRDLKAPNVIVTSGPDEAGSTTGALDGPVRLIDLECQAVGSDSGPAALATRGYCSPSQRALLPPAVADDVFGLGALLWFMATGADPSAAPMPRTCSTGRCRSCARTWPPPWSRSSAPAWPTRPTSATEPPAASLVPSTRRSTSALLDPAHTPADPPPTVVVRRIERCGRSGPATWVRSCAGGRDLRLPEG